MSSPAATAALHVARRNSSVAMRNALSNGIVSRSGKRSLVAGATGKLHKSAVATAAAVVPATNGGLIMWSSTTESTKNQKKNQATTKRHPRHIFSSLATAQQDVEPTQQQQRQHASTVDERVLAAKDDLDLDSIDMVALSELALQACTPLSLLDMYKHASHDVDPHQRLRNAQFLHHELPIRVAQRAVDLLTLPHGLNQAPPIRKVARIYLQYLERFQNMPCPTTPEEETAFTDMLQSLVLDRTAIPTEIARGIQNWKQSQSILKQDLQEMEDALERFFTARVGLRFLCEHFILSSPKRRHTRHDLLGEHSGDDIGCIQTNCNVISEINRVVKQVSQQTKDCYGICPRIELLDCSSNDHHNFTFVPHHLQYMVTELLKNSSRATVQRHLALQLQDPNISSDDMPPVRVVVAKGAEDVTIKIADRGGGVPRSKLQHIWSFAHSTADQEEESKTEFGTNAFTGGATHGFGLPLSKIYATYFGGELTLKSMEGYGLDAYLYLPRLGEACEKLPQRVVVSPGGQDSYPTLPQQISQTQPNGVNGIRRFSSSSQPQQS